MKKSSDKNHTRCPLQELLTWLGDKRREISGISQRMLTATLRNLEHDGILTREVFAVIPPRVEYTLTTLGKDLLHPVQALVGWVEGHWEKIEKSRSTFDAQKG